MSKPEPVKVTKEHVGRVMYYAVDIASEPSPDAALGAARFVVQDKDGGLWVVSPTGTGVLLCPDSLFETFEDSVAHGIETRREAARKALAECDRWGQYMKDRKVEAND